MSDNVKTSWVRRVLGVSVDPAGAAGQGQDGSAARRAAATKCLEAWLDAKERADAGLSRLQAALKSSKDPAMQRIADGGVHAVSSGVQVGIRVALEEFARGADADGAAASKVSQSVAKFRKFLDTDRAVQLCDENPFDVDVSLRPLLGDALNEIDRQIRTMAP